MHKLQSTKSVLYNAEEQKSGVLEIFVCDITFENIPEHRVRIVSELSSDDKQIKCLIYILLESDWDAFVSSADGNTHDGIILSALKYVKTQVSGKYGLTESDWELINL